IARALEVIEATGRSLNDWHRDGVPPLLPPGTFAALFLSPDRDQLYAQIDARFDAMLKSGALAEVAALAARNLDPLLPAMKAHGRGWLRPSKFGRCAGASWAPFYFSEERNERSRWQQRIRSKP